MILAVPLYVTNFKITMYISIYIAFISFEKWWNCGEAIDVLMKQIYSLRSCRFVLKDVALMLFWPLMWPLFLFYGFIELWTYELRIINTSPLRCKLFIGFNKQRVGSGWQSHLSFIWKKNYQFFRCAWDAINIIFHFPFLHHVIYL